MKTILVIVFLVLGVVARADVSGNWTGSLTYTQAEGDGSYTESWDGKMTLNETSIGPQNPKSIAVYPS